MITEERMYLFEAGCICFTDAEMKWLLSPDKYEEYLLRLNAQNKDLR